MSEKEYVRIESELEVKAYLQNLQFALAQGARIDFQIRKRVDDDREEKYTNLYTINTLYPNQNPVDAIKNELFSLSVDDYIQTVKVYRFPKRSDMRVFGRVDEKRDDLYLKIRVEILGMYGNPTTFVMSFHFAERAFTADMFPYKRD